MSEFIIFPSVFELLSDKEHTVLSTYKQLGGMQGPGLLVSGQPLHEYTDTGELHFEQCEPQILRLVHASKISLQIIPIIGHYHIAEKYLSEEGYPKMQCFTPEGTEIIMGMRSILGFEMIINIEDSSKP